MPLDLRNHPVRRELNAQLIAVGKYDDKIVRFLPYEAECYLNVPSGYPVVVPLFWCWHDDEKSRQLASCFGIQPEDFENHNVNPHVADIPELRELFPPCLSDSVNDFIGLREAGFTFHYIPDAI